MNLGIISVRGEEYHPNFRIREAAVKKGDLAFLIHPYRHWPVIQRGKFKLSPNLPHLPDIILPRQGATLGDTCLSLIRHFELMGIKVINGYRAIRLTKDKFLSLQTLSANELPVLPTLLANTPEGIQHAVEFLNGFPVVSKQVSSRQGSGLALLTNEVETQAFIRMNLNRRTGLLIQKFIPPGQRRELRILVIGNVPVGGMELTPEPGDFRANYHLTGKSKPIDPEKTLGALAVRAAISLGLEIAGVDIMIDKDEKPYIVEVNYSPGFNGLETATGLDIAGAIVEYLHKRFLETSTPFEFQ
jgi:ribosomal protein S6--L-glutamate ligase